MVPTATMAETDDSDSDATLDLDYGGIPIAFPASIPGSSMVTPLTISESDCLPASILPKKRLSNVLTDADGHSKSNTGTRESVLTKKTRVAIKSADSHDTIQHQSAKAPSKQKETVPHPGTEAFLFPPDFSEVEFSDDERLEKLDRRPCFSEILPQRRALDIELSGSRGIIPASVSQWLRDYQVHGAAFLHKLFAQQRGGILGDDMGLGKTVQVIAFLTAAFGKTADSRDGKRRRKVRDHTRQWYPRVLLVCPGSLIENWKEELDRWGWWDIQVFHGSSKNRDESIHAARHGHIEVMITTCKSRQSVETFSN